jgi:cytoskeleton protein RodZ
MSSVGAYLREQRQRKGLSLDEVARATRVGARYLEALEADQFSSLLAPVFTRGFIRAYCQAVSVAPDDALRLYDRGIGVSARTRGHPLQRKGGSPAERRPGGTVLMSLVLLVVLGVALFAVTLLLPSGGDRPSRRSAAPRPAPDPPDAEARATTGPAERPAEAPGIAPPHPTATGPAPAAPVAPSARAAPSATATSPSESASLVTERRLSPSPAALGGPAPGTPYRLVARARETTWLQVRMEDGRLTEETIPAGEVREWISDRPFVLTVGNAAGVTLELNGRPLPPLGPKDAVIGRFVVPQVEP